ncbi:hypothetical protein PSACC_01276 [Paramicrosporidium saccamoebae]|uniref:Uncharacterized protein n=1 Tax=Paramicrosporidium saccamoebae TaxID=1246581 RepID=A0A2H9TMG6_9FUNG|nr:hypothetical protein PSACC_01276 [Paramicrosporidium saccamoebae]
MNILRSISTRYANHSGIQRNIANYARYLVHRVSLAVINGRDVAITTADSPDYRHGDVLGMLRDGTLEGLFELLALLTEFQFFVDDLDIPAVLQAAQTIFDNFLYLYGRVTEVLLNLFGTIVTIRH